ncbi:MAG TPA: hypothetical protein VGZ71_06695 [Puia sp.]|nr:hypothetical protein [Puia sp.]
MNTRMTGLLKRQEKAGPSIRRLLTGSIANLFPSGAKALPIEGELSLLLRIFRSPAGLTARLLKLLRSYQEVCQNHPSPI